jgi:hypothetical protein
MTIRYILYTYGFDINDQEKSGNPGLEANQHRTEIFLNETKGKNLLSRHVFPPNVEVDQSKRAVAEFSSNYFA